MPLFVNIVQATPRRSPGPRIPAQVFRGPGGFASVALSKKQKKPLLEDENLEHGSVTNLSGAPAQWRNSAEIKCGPEMHVAIAICRDLSGATDRGVAIQSTFCFQQAISGCRMCASTRAALRRLCTSVLIRAGSKPSDGDEKD